MTYRSERTLTHQRTGLSGSEVPHSGSLKGNYATAEPTASYGRRSDKAN
jgi:hypothetical protein